jgi:hypothetical protein
MCVQRFLLEFIILPFKPFLKHNFELAKKVHENLWENNWLRILIFEPFDLDQYQTTVSLWPNFPKHQQNVRFVRPPYDWAPPKVYPYKINKGGFESSSTRHLW